MAEEYSEDGVYEIDWEELEEMKRKKMTDTNQEGRPYTDEQVTLLRKYWFFFSKNERKEFIIKYFPGRTYRAINHKIMRLLDRGIVFDKPDGFKEPY